MRNKDEILKSEYFTEFDMLRQNRMATSYHKYGKVRDNYASGKVSAIENLKLRLGKYEETGNIEYLLDVGNLAMIEFKFPMHPNANYTVHDNGEDFIKGMERR